MHGEITIDAIETEKLDLELGAGETKIGKLNVSKKADIDGGVGKVSILSGTINNLKLDMGIGEFNIKSTLTGKNDIDSGVGQMNIELEDSIENYTIVASKGIGQITINNKEISSDSEYGNGQSYIKIDGGVGNIKIIGDRQQTL